MQADNSLNCRAALVGSPHLAHAEARRVFEFLNYSLCDGMLPDAFPHTVTADAIECAPKSWALRLIIQRLRHSRLSVW